MDFPLTVLLPTLNCEAFLSEALESLTRQTHCRFHLLVLDGGSSDGTLRIATQWKGLSSKVVHCGRVGLGAQLRAGLDMVATPFVARMDADDISLPGRFKTQLEYLSSHPETAIVGSQISLFANGITMPGAYLPQHHQDIRRILHYGYPAFSHPSIMFKTEAARRSGGYRISGRGEDLDFFLRITECGEGRNLPTVFHNYRVHRDSVSFENYDEVQRGYDYALCCSRARRLSLAEPTETQHAAGWARRGRIRRFADGIEIRAVRLYRKSRIQAADNLTFRAGAGIACSLIMRPRLVKSRIDIQLSKWRGN